MSPPAGNAADCVVIPSWGGPPDAATWPRRSLPPSLTSAIHWFPFVTFWQTTVDMAVSYGVEAPHGHRYGANPVDGWAAIVPPEGWTEADTRRLRRHVEERESPY